MAAWLLEIAGENLTNICYFLAACIAVWGVGSSIWKLASDNHMTGRDVMGNIGLTAVGVAILVGLGTYVSTILGGGV